MHNGPHAGLLGISCTIHQPCVYCEKLASASKCSVHTSIILLMPCTWLQVLHAAAQLQDLDLHGCELIDDTLVAGGAVHSTCPVLPPCMLLCRHALPCTSAACLSHSCRSSYADQAVCVSRPYMLITFWHAPC